MKTNKLVVDFDYSFKMLGIISSAKEYKLAWNMNQLLKIHLIKAEDINLQFQNDCNILVSTYLYLTEYSQIRLLKNKSIEFTNIAKPYLIPELKDYDYFIHILDEGCIFDEEWIKEQLQDCAAIQYIKVIDVSELKSKDNLIFI
ncbi:IPExxxVDY family protein [Cytophaga aurantiaca]|uniref:IPExxxVDY family protein n=1 Tax=Cytophaga aurantiaca TaxID=29530 RepID=UPI00035CCCD2|nr:IPExxxVDY family protein [Cytophaga aurantiaca]